MQRFAAYLNRWQDRRSDIIVHSEPGGPMLRAVFPLLCGCVIALMIGAGSSASLDEPGPVAATSQDVAPRSGAGVCYYVCDMWALYPTMNACLENCPDWAFCERECF
jgi:hypothetical protein